MAHGIKSMCCWKDDISKNFFKRLYVVFSNGFSCQYPLINYPDFHNKGEIVEEKESLDNKISVVNDENQSGLKAQTSFEKPRMSWYKLIIEALNNSSNGMLLSSDIYKAISGKHPYYKMEKKYWKKCISNYLCMSKIFVKEGNTKYWKLDQEELKKKKRISEYQCPLCIEFIGADAIELTGT